MFNFVKTPITVIGAFISLIYGCANWLLSSTVTHLNIDQVWFVLGFIVVFPFVVLFVFYWILTRHHIKLYAPSDFRSDATWMDFVRPVPSAEVEKELSQAAQAWSDEKVDPVKINEAIQKFEREFNVRAEREIEIGNTGIRFDALFYGLRPTLLEVIVLLTPSTAQSNASIDKIVDRSSRAVFPIEKHWRERLSASYQPIELRFVVLALQMPPAKLFRDYCRCRQSSPRVDIQRSVSLSHTRHMSLKPPLTNPNREEANQREKSPTQAFEEVEAGYARQY
eukprot:gene3946-3996_t